MYTSTSSMLVLTKETTLSSLADLQMGSQLTKDYTVLTTSRDVLNQVIENLGLNMNYRQLRASISMDNPTDTRILNISVTNSNPELAKEIVDELASVASAYIGDKMEVIPPKIIEKADTRILNISVTNSNPELAKEIVDELASVASAYIGDKMEVIPPKIIEKAELPTVKTSPSLAKNTMLGLLLGLILSAGIVVVITVMNDSIKTEDDIEQKIQCWDYF